MFHKKINKILRLHIFLNFELVLFQQIVNHIDKGKKNADL